MYIHTSTYIYFGNVLAYVCVCVCGAYNVSTYAHIFILLGVATLPHKVPHTHRTHTHTHIHSCTQTYLFKTNNIQKSTRRKNCCFLFLSPSLGAVQGCRLQTEIELRSWWFPRPPNPTSPAVSVCVSPKCSTNKSTHWRKFCETCTFLLPLQFLCRNE